jgi:hypothetical protein
LLIQKREYSRVTQRAQMMCTTAPTWIRVPTVQLHVRIITHRQSIHARAHVSASTREAHVRPRTLTQKLTHNKTHSLACAHTDGPQCKDMDVLEIGCGLALPGLVAGATAAHVTLADCDDRALERLQTLDLNPSKCVALLLLCAHALTCTFIHPIAPSPHTHAEHTCTRMGKSTICSLAYSSACLRIRTHCRSLFVCVCVCVCVSVHTLTGSRSRTISGSKTQRFSSTACHARLGGSARPPQAQTV